MSIDQSTLIEIYNACLLIQDFTKNYSKKKFMGDLKTQSAVLHQLLIIGEAVKRLSVNIKSKHNKIPWKEISGMRDKLIHAYDEINMEIIWNTIELDVVNLKNQLQTLIKSWPK